MTIANTEPVLYVAPVPPASLEGQLQLLNERVARMLVDLAALRWDDNGENFHGQM